MNTDERRTPIPAGKGVFTVDQWQDLRIKLLTVFLIAVTILCLCLFGLLYLRTERRQLQQPTVVTCPAIPTCPECQVVVRARGQISLRPGVAIQQEQR
jgi:hypothetical protein